MGAATASEAANEGRRRGRREIKFVSRASEGHRLMHRLRLHRARFGRPYPPRWVNNVYFDTHDCAAFAENLSGVSGRLKVRYRWYGSLREPHRGSLEVKRKRNIYGWKLRFAVDAGPYRPGADWRAVRGELRRALAPEGRLWLDGSPVPVLINRYYRHYLLSADRRTRVTLDTRQSIWDQRHRSHPSLLRRVHVPDALVVEFKFDPAHHAAVSAMLHDIPLRLSRHSKYAHGLGTMLAP